MSIWFWVMICVYLGILIFVGSHSYRKTKSAEDYIMAGSRVGVIVGMLTFAATLFSTFTLMGMPDFFRTHGVGAWIFLAISDAGMFFFVLWFGLKLRRVASRYDYQGMSGMLTGCYGTMWAGRIYFAGVFFFLIPYVAIQIRGIAVFLGAGFPDVMPAWGWSLAIVCVMLLYSEFGGLRAIIHCDCIQGTILLVVLWIIAVGCVRTLGGVESMFEKVADVNEALLSTPGPKGLFTPQFLIGSFFAILFIPVTQPQVTTRLVIIKSKRTLKHMSVGLGIFTLLVLLPTIAIGLYGSIQYPDAPAQAFWAQVLLYEPPDLIAAVVVVGLLAAATSTADSQLFALGSELRSLMLLKGQSSLIYTRLAVFIFGAAALVFSLVSGNQLVSLALASFKGTALLAPMVFCGLFSRSKPGLEVVAATAVGLGLYLFSHFGIVPATVGPVRLDLLLLAALGAVAILSALLRKAEAPS